MTTACLAQIAMTSKGGMDGLPVPIDVYERKGKINTLTVFNSGLNFRLFWDGRAATLEDQMTFPIRNKMGTTIPEIIAKLKTNDSYRRDFSAIYQ